MGNDNVNDNMCSKTHLHAPVERGHVPVLLHGMTGMPHKRESTVEHDIWQAALYACHAYICIQPRQLESWIGRIGTSTRSTPYCSAYYLKVPALRQRARLLLLRKQRG